MTKPQWKRFKGAFRQRLKRKRQRKSRQSLLGWQLFCSSRALLATGAFENIAGDSPRTRWDDSVLLVGGSIDYVQHQAVRVMGLTSATAMRLSRARLSLRRASEGSDSRKMSA